MGLPKGWSDTALPSAFDASTAVPQAGGNAIYSQAVAGNDIRPRVARLSTRTARACRYFEGVLASPLSYRGSEGLMSRPRAADDFKTIRTRMEELRREKLLEEAASAVSTTDAGLAGHRGPCACGRSLFPDECDGSCKF